MEEGYVSFEDSDNDSLSLKELILNVRANTRNPFRRGKHIRALQNYILNSADLAKELPDDIILGNLLSVINDCLFPGQIEDILTQNKNGPCLLAALKFVQFDFSPYPAIQKVAEKYTDISLLVHKFIECMKPDLTGETIRTVFTRFKNLHADFNARDARGNTPLLVAVKRGLYSSSSVSGIVDGGYINPDCPVAILVEKFGALLELSNDKLETAKSIPPEKTAPPVIQFLMPFDAELHTFIETRDLTWLGYRIDESNERNNAREKFEQQLMRVHPKLGTPVNHLRSLIQKYEDEKRAKIWHTFSQWRNYRKLKKMQDVLLNYVIEAMRKGDFVRLSLLEVLDQFTPEKIEARLWDDVFQVNSALFGSIEVSRNLQQFPNVVATLKNMRGREARSRELPVYDISVRSSAGQIARGTSGSTASAEEPAGAYEPHYGKVLVPSPRTSDFNKIAKWLKSERDARQFQDSWVVDMVKDWSGNGEHYFDQLLTNHWDLLFRAAKNPDPALLFKSSEREHVFVFILLELNRKAEVLSPEFKQKFARLLKSIPSTIMQEAFLPAVIHQKPEHLLLVMKSFVHNSVDPDLVGFGLTGIIEKLQTAMKPGFLGFKSGK